MPTASHGKMPSGHITRTIGLIAGAVAVILGLGVVAALALLDLRRDAILEARRSADNLVEAVGQEISRTLATYDLSLIALDQALSLPDIGTVSPEMRQAALFDGSADAPFMGSMLATDAAGIVRVGNHAAASVGDDLSGQAFFLSQRNPPASGSGSGSGPGFGMVISQPFQARNSGAWVIALSRRRTTPDGSFGGIVVGTLRLDYFVDLAKHFHLGKGASLALITTDGTFLARVPTVPGLIGQKFRQGTPSRRFMTESSGDVIDMSMVDGRRRLYSFSGVAGSRLVVVAGIATDTIYTGWASQVQVIGPILLLLTVLAATLLILAESLRRQLRLRRRAERSSRSGSAIYQVLAEQSVDVVTCLNPTGTIIYVSPSIGDLLGFAPDDLVGYPFVDTLHEEDRAAVLAELARLRHGTGRATITYRALHRDGRPIWVETAFRQLHHPRSESPEEVVGTTRDVTRRKIAEDESNTNTRALTLMAMTDALTGLGNRRHFDLVLEAEWLRARRDGITVSLLMIDADLFKSYNDTYGHPAGDAVLRAIAGTLREHARRPADFVARYGGEEFAVILPATEVEGALMVAEQIRRGLAAMAIAHVGSPAGHVTVSIGVASAVGDGQGSGPNLVEGADAALYQAKRLGRDRTEIYGAATTPLRSLRT